MRSETTAHPTVTSSNRGTGQPAPDPASGNDRGPTPSCCAATVRASCCAPEEKAGCCGAGPASTTCGCQA